MKTKKEKKQQESCKSLFGALNLNETADEFLQRIDKDRNFNREEIDL